MVTKGLIRPKDDVLFGAGIRVRLSMCAWLFVFLTLYFSVYVFMREERLRV